MAPAMQAANPREPGAEAWSFVRLSDDYLPAARTTAVLAPWPTACLQRGRVHKEGNREGVLRKGDQAAAARGWKRRRRVQGAVAGRKARAHVRTCLRPLNAAATPSRGEAGEAPIALAKLTGPAPRHVSRWSTNAKSACARIYRGEQPPRLPRVRKPLLDEP